MGYKGATNLWNIARSAGMPLKIDPLSLKKTEPFSHILVDIDFSTDFPERVLVQKKSGSYEFYANLFYEFVLYFCHHCGTLGHKEDNCGRLAGNRN